MNWALEALGLDDDADTRAIKRAYAARLKLTRPDDDPAGFQRLHETYQAALAWSRYRAETAAAEQAERPQDGGMSDAGVGSGQPAASPQAAYAPPADVRPADALRPASAQPDATPRPVPDIAADWIAPPQVRQPDVDVEQVQRRILQHAGAVDAQNLQQWLVSQPELWSLELKPQIGSALQRSLLAESHALIADNYDVLAEFFDWQQALDAPDPYLVEQARTCMHRRWLLQPAGHARLARQLQRCGDASASVPQVRRMLGWLAPAEPEGTALATMLWPGRASRVRRLLDLIGYVPGDSKPPSPLDRESALRWYMASQRDAFSPMIAALGLVRSAIVGMAFLLLCLLLAMVDHNPTPGMSPVLKVGLWGAVISVGGWAAWYALTCLQRWQCRPESDPRVEHPWLQRLFIPAIGVLAGTLIVVGLKQAATFIALPLLLIALLRWIRRDRATFQFQWSWGWAWAALLCTKAAFMGFGYLVLYPQAALLGTAIAWSADLISHWSARRTAAH
ncbi:J domain-containing protein [Xanthomonas campestris]|uniref:J domain-containing protein n=1 Tax=Xanthomonas campestris TaxID=339 RepID=UPI001E61B4FC|nr:J domain-containing protein [Xanthomonas campestris]MCC4604499.1 J domain-containing protein [Xanthomonas campestris pv. parthenii]